MASELIKELGKMLGLMKELFEREKDHKTKRGLLELLLMVDDKLNKSCDCVNLKIGTPYYLMVLERIKETKNVVNQFKQKSKNHSNLLEHVMKVTNEVEGLLFGLETTSNPILEEHPINKKNKEKIT